MEESTIMNLDKALNSSFQLSNTSMVILGYYAIGVFKCNDKFVIFDSHARDSMGYVDQNGKSVVLYFNCLEDLIFHCMISVDKLNLQGSQFHVQPVKFQIQPLSKNADNNNSNTKLEINESEHPAKCGSSLKRRNNAALRLQGKDYIGYKRYGNKIEQSEQKLAKSVKERCSHSDVSSKSTRSFMCGVVSDDDRKAIFNQFWNMSSWEAKKTLVKGLVACR